MSGTFICTAKPAYNWQETIAKLEPHQFEAWRRGARSLADKLKDSNQATFKADVSHIWEGLLMDGEEVDVWDKAGVELTISRVKGLASNAAHLPDVIYQISVANVGLMQIQLVDVLEDCCTDELQRQLDRGWRILAVCPPNDARRPTYVMGHFEKEGHR